MNLGAFTGHLEPGLGSLPHVRRRNLAASAWECGDLTEFRGIAPQRLTGASRLEGTGWLLDLTASCRARLTKRLGTKPDAFFSVLKPGRFRRVRCARGSSRRSGRSGGRHVGV